MKYATELLILAIILVGFAAVVLVPLSFLKTRVRQSLTERGFDDSEPWHKHATELPQVLFTSILLSVGILAGMVYSLLSEVSDFFPNCASSLADALAITKPVALAVLSLAFYFGWRCKTKPSNS